MTPDARDAMDAMRAELTAARADYERLKTYLTTTDRTSLEHLRNAERARDWAVKERDAARKERDEYAQAYATKLENCNLLAEREAHEANRAETAERERDAARKERDEAIAQGSHNLDLGEAQVAVMRAKLDAAEREREALRGLEAAKR